MTYIGYLLVCMGLECVVMTKEFDNFIECDTEGQSLVVNMPLVNPSFTTVSYQCLPAGVAT